MIQQRQTRIYSAAQAKPVSFVGTAASGSKTFHIKCMDWVWLSADDKLAYASKIRNSDPRVTVSVINDYCNRRLLASVKPSALTKPAGQASDLVYNDPSGGADMTFNLDNTVTGRDGTTYDAGGAVGETPYTPPASTGATAPSTIPEGTNNPTVFLPPSATGGTTNVTPSAAPSAPLLTPQQQTALLGAVGGLLSTTGTAISAAIQSNNQLELSRLQTQAQLEIARLQTQSQQSMSAGNLTLAQQQAQAAAQLQMFQNMLAAQSQGNTLWYVLAGVAAVVVIGAAIYFAPTIRQSAQPAIMRSTRSQTRSKR